MERVLGPTFSDVQARYDEDVTVANIQRDLKDLVKKYKRVDPETDKKEAVIGRLYIMLAGHGVEDEDGAYFCAHEAKSPHDLFGTAFLLEQRNIKSSCCYSRVCASSCVSLLLPHDPSYDRPPPRVSPQATPPTPTPQRHGLVPFDCPEHGVTAEPNPARAATTRLHCSDQNGRCDTATNRAYGAPWSWYWSTTRRFTWRCRARINTARRAFHAPAWACASLHGPWRPPEHAATP